MAIGNYYVLFDVGATAEEAANAKDAFELAGMSADVSEDPYAITASGGLPEISTPFVVIRTVAASAFIAAFATRAAQDGYDALKRLIHRLRAARVKDGGRLDVIIRGDEGPDIFIGADTPDGALSELLTNPLPPAPSGELVYDITSRRWRDSKRA